ncbi:MAG: hypothetical protein GF330_10600 [Candidatus Eisenbacteria bacterium]|nr:hypothetical protein [Candidatus Eisenbacteria bacterium]
MAKRVGKGGSTANLIVGILLVAAILVLINVIATSRFVRLDLTEQKEFTISDATKEILGDLQDLVTITVYMSEDLPPQLSTLRRQIADILDEYRNYGRGHVQIDFVDPASDPAIEQRLRTLGIPQITAQTLERDQFQALNIYLGMHISYLDQQEVIPVVQDTYTLEYDLTSRILKVSQDEEYVVGVLSGPVEHELSSDLTSLQSMLEGQFRVRSVSLRDGESEVPAEVDVLIVAGPARVPDGVKYRLDQYLMRGGKAIFLVDEVRIPRDGGLQAVPVSSGLGDLLAHYGVRVQKALVLDRVAETATFTSGFVRYTLPYPYWPKAVPELLNAENPITQRLESLTLPWVAPLELDVPIGAGDPITRIREMEAAEEEARQQMAEQLGVDLAEEESIADSLAEAGNEAEAAGDAPDAVPGEPAPEAPLVASVLARSSPQAWTVAGRYDLNPQQRFSAMGAQTKSEILAVTLTGTLGSFYRDREVPPLGPETDSEPEGEELAAAPAEEPILQSPETQLIVVGNAHFITDSFLGQFPANGVFFQNAIDWMTIGDYLITIRSRGATDRPLRPLSDTAKSLIKLVCIAAVPLLVIIFGLVRFTIRRRAWSAREVAARDS